VAVRADSRSCNEDVDQTFRNRLSKASRPGMGHTQPPIQRLPGAFPLGVVRGQGVKLTIHTHLEPAVRISGAAPYVFMGCRRTTLHSPSYGSGTLR